MTHPLIRTLTRITEMEARMDDEANDRREGYCDGMAGKRQRGRSKVYRESFEDGRCDEAKLRGVAERKRRAAL